MAASLFAERQQAPDFELPDLNGNRVRLSDYAGQVVVLDFWATWCPPCQEEIPHFNELQKEYGSQGFQIIGIALDHAGARVVRPFAQKFRMNYIVLAGDSSKIIEDYGGLVGVPTTFVLDRKGYVVKTYIGYVEKEEIENLIQKLL